jgi:hypothetical protein
MNAQPIPAIATILEWQGKTLIIAAEDMDTLKSYLTDQDQPGFPEARHVAVTLGPAINNTSPHIP